MLIWFLLHCILSDLSSFVNFDFSFFFSLIPIWLPLVFSQTFLFLISFTAFNLLLLSFWFFRTFKPVCSPHIIYFCWYRSLSFSPPSLYLILSVFIFNALWERLLLLTRIKLFFYKFGSPFFVSVSKVVCKKIHRNFCMYTSYQE